MTKYFQFLSFVLLYSLYYSTVCPAIQYHHDQSLLLLTVKESFSIDPSNSDYCESSYPKTTSWNKSTDCCTWDGVICDEITGNVIELDLSCSQLSGSIDSESSLFQFPHLWRLNLAYNRIESSQISMIFGNFSHLAHLNLSRNEFSGQIPSEILKLTELTSLDLSYNAFTVGPEIFKLLLTNFTNLSQVILTNLNIPSSIPKNLSSSLEIVQLDGYNLQGELPKSIFHLPKLKTLRLGGNSQLHGFLPSDIWNSSATLEWLDLFRISFSGNIPDSIRNLKGLKYLDLSFCGFSGSLPKGIFSNMTQIESIKLAGNKLIGYLPSFPREAKHLKILSLNSNSFSGTITPSWLLSLSSLQLLSLSMNQLSGPLPNELFTLVSLQWLDLYHNQLSGHVPMKLSSLVDLQWLDLSSNQLSGHLPMELFTLGSLQHLDLGYNQFSGHLPMELSSLINLQQLILSKNNFSGDVHVDIFSNMKQLKFLGLSYNRLSVVSKNNCTLPESIVVLQLASCNITELGFLKSALDIQSVDLSRNKILEVPSWLWSQWYYIAELTISYNSITHKGDLQFQQIRLLDIQSNLFQGQFPQVPSTIAYMLLSNNQFSGTIPTSIVCRLGNLVMFDVSNNSFTGSIPQCIGYISQSLSVLDMRMNKFEGTMPTMFSSMMLETLNLYGNHLRGNIPTSLATCLKLKFLDLGKNNFNDSFPSWLGMIPNLTVLSLRSNSFHGKIILSGTSPFSKLQILDLSHNHFIGTLPPELFNNLSGLMEINETSDAAISMLFDVLPQG